MDILESITANQVALKALLDSGSYLHCAGPLRLLLADTDVPLLQKYSEQVKRPLRVWSMEELKTRPILKQGLISFVDPLVCDWDPRKIPDHQCYEFLDFLDKELCAAADGKFYTPRQIIKAAANKLGVTHFDPLNSQKYLRDALAWKVERRVPGGEISVRTLVEQQLERMARWAVAAITYLQEEELEYTIFVRVERIGDTEGELLLFSFQEKGIANLSISEESIRLKTKNDSWEAQLEPNSCLFLIGRPREIDVYFCSTEKPTTTLKTEKIVTSSTLGVENRIEGMKGGIGVWGRHLNPNEIEALAGGAHPFK